MFTTLPARRHRAAPGGVAQSGFGQRNEMERRHDIDLMEFVPHLRSGGGKVSVRNDSTDAGVVDKHVELASRGDCLADKPDPVGFQGEIGLYIDSLLHFSSHCVTFLCRTSRMKDHCIARVA